MKIACFGDVHIRNLKYHKEYLQVFQQFYEKIKQEQVDVVILLGDLCHTKTSISPEYVELASNLLKNTADIAPLYVILGNHDLSVKNLTRQDSITPIVDSLNHPNLFLLKNSQEVKISDEIVLNCLSIVDKENWIKTPSDLSKINIALYHGSVTGCKTDLGWEIAHGDASIETFKDFDFTFLGDIHKTFQKMTPDGRVVYPGSFLQQNFAETDDKGFLLWDISTKSDFQVKHIQIPNPKPFITIALTKSGRIPKNFTAPKEARLRLVAESNISFDAMKRVMDVAKQRYKPESITFVNRVGENDRKEIDEGIAKQDLRDPAIQEELIQDYLKPYEVEQAVLEDVLLLNRKYNTVIEQEEEISRNVNWSLKKLEWDNLFNYGKDNSIDFENVSGAVGLLAPNRAGKSSVVDALLYTVYNTTSKNARKNLNIVNQNKATGRGYVEIEVGDKLYCIERTTEKYEKASKGGSILEAKTMVEFSVKYEDGTIESLNGVSRQDTDRNIRRVFGEIDDFLLTSLSSQFGSLSYINEGSTKRKEILARFLDLEIFDRKFKMAKEEVGEIKGTLKRLESKDFDSEIEDTKEKLIFNKERLEQEKEKCSTIKSRIINVDSEIRKCEMSIASTPVVIIDIDKTEKSLKLNEEELEAVEKRTASLKEEVAENKLQIQKIEDFLSSTFDIDGYKEKKELIRDKTKEQDLLNWEIKTKQKELKDREKRTKLLGEVPCEDKYPGCKLLKDSHRAAEEAKTLAKELLEIEEAREKINTLISDLEPEKIDGYLEKYEKLVNRKNDLSSTLSTKEISRQKNKTKIEVLNQKIAECKAQQAEYYKNKEAIENLGNIKEEKKQHEKELKSLNNQLDSCDKNVLEHVKVLGSVEQKLKDLEKQKEELSTLRKQYEAYDLFLRCMHSDGITYGIIKKRLPVINNEIAKVLANIANFEVFFENEGRKLLIYIKHPKFEPRPLELGSGAEKSISAMAIRLALISVSSLPKPDLMVLDEPGTALDSEMLEGFSRIVELVKVQFKTVIIISHLDSLKDAVDQQIIIEKTKNGYSKIKH